MEPRSNALNLKPPGIQIDPEDIYKLDLLERKSEIDNLTAVIKNVNSPAVFAIDSRWGTGKTTFIKLWEQALKKQGICSLYFNAWETDFSDDPLVSFLGEMNEGLKGLTGSSPGAEKAWAAAKTIGKQIAKRGIPALVKISTLGVIDSNEIYEDVVAGAMEAIAGDALDAYLKQKKAVARFRESLKEVVSFSPNGLPVVIFIDELDRCRPLYAISLLERIKHLFNIEGLIFVLAMDKSQLTHSIGAIYGQGIDAAGYLRRFIDFEYQLRRPDIKKYIESLFGSYSLNAFFDKRTHPELRQDRTELFSTFVFFAELNKLSFREIEQLLASINLALRSAKDNEYIHAAFMTFLIVVKNSHPSIYQNYISPENSEVELIKHLHNIVPLSVRLGDSPCAFVEGCVIGAKNRNRDTISDVLAEHRQKVLEEGLDYKTRAYSEHVAEIAGGQHRRLGQINLEVVVKRVEFSSQFQFDG